MTISELIRKGTQIIRDNIDGINLELSQAESKRNAAEERFKRIGSEISKLRSNEGEKKQEYRDASDKVIEAQRILEEIDQKRQEVLETLMKCRDEEKEYSKKLNESRVEIENALSAIEEEKKSRQDTDQILEKCRIEFDKKKKELDIKLIDALEQYLKLQSETVLDTFSTQEQYQKRVQQIESFKKARHSDPEIAKLWEQREEIKKFIESSSVPGVKIMLQETLNKLEKQLVIRFPEALNLPETTPRDNRIEEMLYYCNKEDKVVLLLPFRIFDWEGAQIDEVPENSSRVMCIVWNLLQSLKLKADDGKFILERNRPVFSSEFDIDSFATLDGFSVKSKNLEVVKFIFKIAPRELQDALNNEN